MAERFADRFASLREMSANIAVADLQRRLLQLGREAAARDKVDPPSSGCDQCCDGWIVERRHARRCECWLRARALPGVPVEWRSLRLADVDRHAGNRVAVDAVAKFVAGKSSGPICVTGGVGTGKTMLMVAAGNEMFWGGAASAFYLRFGDFIDAHLRGQKFDDDEAVVHLKKVNARARNADPLVLDDVGAGAKDSDFTQQELYKLLVARKDAGRRSLLTTNLSDEDMSARLDHRIVSRLFEGEVIKVYGRDRRVKRPSLKVASSQ